MQLKVELRFLNHCGALENVCSVHIRTHNLLTKGLNFKIYVLVNCVSVKLHTSFDGKVCINILCMPITIAALLKTKDVCGDEHVRLVCVHLCMLNLAKYRPK